MYKNKCKTYLSEKYKVGCTCSAAGVAAGATDKKKLNRWNIEREKVGSEPQQGSQPDYPSKLVQLR